MESWIWSISRCIFEYWFSSSRASSVLTVSGRCRFSGWQEARPHGCPISKRWQCHSTVATSSVWDPLSWIALVMWRCIQCQPLRMTGKSCIKPGEWCNGKLWYSNINRFCNFDMFRNFVKNSNPMCDVALSMWLLFSLFPRNWQVLRQQRARTSKNTGAPPWQKPETARTSENRLFLRC